jgi:hypothetical protein
MSFFSELIAGGAAGLATGIGTLAKDLREAFTGKTIIDPAKQEEFILKMAALQDAAVARQVEFEKAVAEGQLAINKVEAASASLFVSGWRPAVGWVCVSGLFYTFILKPILPWMITVGALLTNRVSVIPPLPEVPMGDLIVLLAGMLGLAVTRSVDKYNALPKGTGG